MGTVRHSDERARAAYLQPVRVLYFALYEFVAQPSGRNDFVEIMEMLDKRLNDKGKNWRHVFKVCTMRLMEPLLPLTLSLIPQVSHAPRLLSTRRIRERGHLLP
jgi:hypothetical protein